jgi:hypothetical protein
VDIEGDTAVAAGTAIATAADLTVAEAVASSTSLGCDEPLGLSRLRSLRPKTIPIL